MSTQAPDAPRAPDPLADGTAFYRFSAFLGVLAVAVFAAAMVWFNLNGRFDRSVGALLGIAALLGVLYVIPRWDEVLAALGTRTARRGSNATLLSIAFIGLLAVGNWWANRHSPQWDLTQLKRYSLSDQTTKILRGLKQDVKVIAFFPSQEDSYTRGAKDLLRLYDKQSDKLTVQFVDPDIERGTALQYNITSAPVTLFLVGDRREETTNITEQDFTSALLKVTRTEKKKVYFLQGHQERDPDSSQQTGYRQAADQLKRENYDVDKLSFFATPRVPDDAAVLVVAGPKAPLLDNERDAIKEYLDRGGKLMFLAEPRQDVGMAPLLEQWSLQLDNDLVVDPGRSLQNDPFTPAPVPQAGHRITVTLSDLILPLARSIQVKQGAGSELVIAPLLKTTDRAWGETNFNAPAAPNPGEDVNGPLTLAVAINKAPGAPSFTPNATPTPTPVAGAKEQQGRLVVVGNAEFASNTFIGQVLGNRDFFVNTVNWLAEEEDLISIRAVPNESPPIMLTNQTQVLVLYAAVVFIPLGVLVIGAVIWWQRR
ncbi:MAG TPA: DUF4350 domain-containing protein [Chloroflexota bacterium]|nr:DUF4350 domain-containing protein [Chloroflexota bacterium]